MYNVFISYLREDKRQVLRLADELRSNGAVVWVDESDLLTGAPWREEIAEAIRQAEFFLACFSSTYERRPNNGMLEELNYVIKWRRAGNTYPEILPVKLNACDIPNIQIDSQRKLNDLHWSLLDDENWEASVRLLVEITLRKAKERAEISLKADAAEVAEKKSQMVRAEEELTTQQGRAIRQQVFSQYSQQHSTDLRRFEPPDVWLAQQSTKKKMEYEHALSQYHKHQIEFTQRFGEEYHPLSEFFDKMDEEARLIRKSFEDARRAEDEQIGAALKGLFVLFLLVAAVAILLSIILGWLKFALGF